MSRSVYNTFRIPAPTDFQIVELFDSILSPFEGSAFAITIGNASTGSYRSAEEFKGDESYSHDKFSKQVTRVDANFDNITLEFGRYITTPHGVQSSLWESEIAFYANNGSISPQRAKYISAKIDTFVRKGLKTPSGTTRDDEGKSAMAAEVMQLAALQRQIVLESDEARRRRDEEFEARKANLEQEIQEERQSHLKEISKETEKLNNLAQELEAQKKRLDDRSHMHVRREMREKITETLRERLKTSGVPKSSEGLRVQIFSLCVITAILFSAIGFISAVEISQLLKVGAYNSMAFYIASARLAASSAAAGGTVFYLLGWFKRLHDNDLRTHRDLERYLYDVDRASWVVETMLESQRKGENELPAEIPHDWVLGVTHGLFARNEPRDESQATMEALGSLLNFAAEAELGPQGPRIKLTKAGIKRLSKSGSLETSAE
jgi:hypothetical protein